ncbi:uncharacterized protein DFL_001174 [Arthrobotrys flagrans]|uniref:Vacuolar ATPase assembly protein VMA22 n=1 Tax=Arthrobotrys flagrans TaxID=97331 RepID=A0A437AGF3_ARTFL|nr:hypothetical protein DFL_001174 [Arthrobotrys flagrans]
MATQQELDELQDKLDLLIISYLDLFDKYQASRAEISRALSDGFFNLAQANFNAPNRVRYGQDMYDNRMQALRGVHIAVNEADVTEYTLKDLTSPPEVASSEKVDPEVSSKLDGSDLKPDKEKASEIAGRGDSDTPDVEPNDNEVALKLANPKADPLRWFGILRPMTLGAAQKNFVHSLPPIMKLISTLSDIEYHEKRIRDLRNKVRGMRKGLGINIDDGLVEEPVAMPVLDKLSISNDKARDETIDDLSEDKKDSGQQLKEVTEKATRE